MAKLIMFAVVILGVSVPLQVLAYTYLSKMDTTSGFCEVSEELKIPVGDIVFDDEACERLTCDDGLLSGAGCGSVSINGLEDRCEIVRGDGNYPDCCPSPICDWNKEM